MLLVLNVVYNNIIPAHATKDLHRSRAWASDWLKRYDKEGIEGTKRQDKKSGVDQQKYQKTSVTRLRKNYPAPNKDGQQNRQKS